MADAREQTVLPAAAALSFCAALIHASVAPAHFGEYWGFGVFFVVIGGLQLVWAELVRRGDADRRLLLLAVAGNLAVAVVWLISRTVGLPIGPQSGQAEGVGLHDVLATLDELTIALVVLVALAGDRAGASRGPVRALAWGLAVVSFVGAFLGSHSAT